VSGLISVRQMGAISALAEKGMITTVEIFRRSGVVPSASDDYGDNVEYDETNPSRRGKVQGWLRTVPASQAGIDAGAVVTDTMWELRVPSGTDIQAGDDVTIKTVKYTVVSSDTDNTYLPYIKCNLRTREG
jgi:hypothetical protein